MADFNLCYSFLLPNEDYTPPRYQTGPDPTRDDPGAQAISGINSASWPADFALINAIQPPNIRAQAVANFYHVRFWNQWFQQLTSNRIAAMTLDASVNQGASWGVKFLQSACGAEMDGIWGPNTVTTANMADPAVMVPRFIAAREQRYRQIGGPSLPEWLARAAKVPTFL
jgi:lysozyme family protein